MKKIIATTIASIVLIASFVSEADSNKEIADRAREMSRANVEYCYSKGLPICDDVLKSHNASFK
jgi:hypothetical protein